MSDPNRESAVSPVLEDASPGETAGDTFLAAEPVDDRPEPSAPPRTLAELDESLAATLDELIDGEFETVDAVLDGVFQEQAALVQMPGRAPAEPNPRAMRREPTPSPAPPKGTDVAQPAPVAVAATADAESPVSDEPGPEPKAADAPPDPPARPSRRLPEVGPAEEEQQVDQSIDAEAPASRSAAALPRRSPTTVLLTIALFPVAMALRVLSAPVRSFSPRGRTILNWLAISLLAWVPIVWLIVLMKR